MTAGAGGDSNEPVRAFVDGLMGKGVVDNVVQHDAAVGMDGMVDIFTRSQRSNHDWNTVLDAKVKIKGEAVIGFMNDKVHREGSRLTIRMRRIMRGKFSLNSRQPLLHLFRRTRIEGRKAAHHARLAL